jgi:methanogenic corrinoid protein MtbC1
MVVPQDETGARTSAGDEGDMFDELITKAKAAGFTVSEIITHKDFAVNAIYSKHFPEGTITYCANHCAKTMHKDLLKIKACKCQVVVQNILHSISISVQREWLGEVQAHARDIPWQFPQQPDI